LHAIHQEDAVQESAVANLKAIEQRLLLRRVVAVHYFICASCGDEIEPARLTALPATSLCAACAQRSD